MGLGVVITLERELPGIDTRSISGRAIAAKRHDIDSIAHELDLRGLGEFVSFSQVEAEALADDMKFDAPVAGRGRGRWFSSAEALEVMRAVMSYLRENPDEIDDHEPVLVELDAMAKVLEVAASENVGFRFSVDY